MLQHEERLNLALEALEGLSVADALGEALSYRYYEARELCDFSAFRDATVRYTDDTEMALAVFDTLKLTRTIEEDTLAWLFSTRFKQDPDRGYGKMARRILSEISAGAAWEDVSKNAFGGGSFGNGSAMRVAPLGAYFSDDLQAVCKFATRSARVTHYHPEGIAGAIAVAVSAAIAVSSRTLEPTDTAANIWKATIEHTPDSTVRQKIALAQSMDSATPKEAAQELGNGAEISAQDTVPFCIWNACRCLADYKEAFISTIEVGGDCDTNGAIVGGIVSSYGGTKGIPKDWIRVREHLKFR